jgi:hypothetical protein
MARSYARRSERDASEDAVIERFVALKMPGTPWTRLRRGEDPPDYVANHGGGRIGIELTEVLAERMPGDANFLTVTGLRRKTVTSRGNTALHRNSVRGGWRRVMSRLSDVSEVEISSVDADGREIDTVLKWWWEATTPDVGRAPTIESTDASRASGSLRGRVRITSRRSAGHGSPWRMSALGRAVPAPPRPRRPWSSRETRSQGRRGMHRWHSVGPR